MNTVKLFAGLITFAIGFAGVLVSLLSMHTWGYLSLIGLAASLCIMFAGGTLAEQAD